MGKGMLQEVSSYQDKYVTICLYWEAYKCIRYVGVEFKSITGKLAVCCTGKPVRLYKTWMSSLLA